LASNYTYLGAFDFNISSRRFKYIVIPKAEEFKLFRGRFLDLLVFSIEVEVGID
jgi:hypothetical protein